ncbi:hypothetical protein SAMN05880558_102212 [Aeromonas sp. RU39B]|nr:hypothetical protein SAMN05880558_102212 [Aeromonas sp. RU39B]
MSRCDLQGERNQPFSPVSLRLFRSVVLWMKMVSIYTCVFLMKRDGCSVAMFCLVVQFGPPSNW